MSPGVYTNAAAVTPSDAAKVRPTVGLYVGGAGDVAVVFVSGDTATFSAVPAGTVLPVEVVQVKATGTTATLILALR